MGDDLAYDVGGSSACGARTILMDLDDKYGQTAKLMFAPPSSSSTTSADGNDENGEGGDCADGNGGNGGSGSGKKHGRPGWAFRPSPEELINHGIMNDRARGCADKTVRFVSGLTDAIEDILHEE